MTKRKSKRKTKTFDTSNLQLEVYKNVVNITETLVHFKDILKSLLDIGGKTATDMQVMNAKWNSIKEKIDDVSECVDEIQKSTTMMLAQLDLKEKERFVAKLDAKKVWKEKKKFQWQDVWNFITKNPWLVVIIILIIVGLFLVASGMISGELFWNGLTGKNLPKPN
jgi:hypothetical protein